MAIDDIITLSTKNPTKYAQVIKFIKEYWEQLTIDELMLEVHLRYNVKLTRGNLDTLKTSKELKSKSSISASKRKRLKVEIPEKLARTIFLQHWDMRSYETVEEVTARNKDFVKERDNNLISREIEKYGRHFVITEEELEGSTLDIMNEKRIKNRR